MSRIFEQYPDGEKMMMLQLSNVGARETIVEQREDIEDAQYMFVMLKEAIEMEGGQNIQASYEKIY